MKFIYSFGYMTPLQVRNQDKHGWDDEDSWEILIEADNGLDAMESGREIAERFVQELFAPEPASWKAMRFTDGLRPPKSPEDCGAFSVRAGEHPDYQWMVAEGDAPVVRRGSRSAAE